MITFREGSAGALAALFLVLLSGCDPPIVEPGDNRIIWSYSNTQWTSVQPYADDELAVFVDNGGEIIALDPETGEVVWEQRVPIPAEVSHRRVPNTNVISFQDLIIVSVWHIYAFDRTTGEERWRYSPPDDFPGYNPLTIDEAGRLVAAGRYLHLLDTTSGDLQWRRDLGEQPFAPVLADGVAYLGTRDMSDDPVAAGHAIAVDANTGELLWKHPIPDAPPPDPWDGGAVGRGALTGDLFVVAGGNARVYGLDRQTGEVVWDYQGAGPYNAAVVIIDGVAIVGSLSGHAEGIDTSSGRGIWRIGLGSSIRSVTRGHEVAIVNNSPLEALTAEGDVVWRYGDPEFGGAVTPAEYHDGVVYFGSFEGFHALAPMGR